MFLYFFNDDNARLITDFYSSAYRETCSWEQVVYDADHCFVVRARSTYYGHSLAGHATFST